MIRMLLRCASVLLILLFLVSARAENVSGADGWVPLETEATGFPLETSMPLSDPVAEMLPPQEEAPPLPVEAVMDQVIQAAESPPEAPAATEQPMESVPVPEQVSTGDELPVPESVPSAPSQPDPVPPAQESTIQEASPPSSGQETAAFPSAQAAEPAATVQTQENPEPPVEESSEIPQAAQTVPDTPATDRLANLLSGVEMEWEGGAFDRQARQWEALPEKTLQLTLIFLEKETLKFEAGKLVYTLPEELLPEMHGEPSISGTASTTLGQIRFRCTDKGRISLSWPGNGGDKRSRIQLTVSVRWSGNGDQLSFGSGIRRSICRPVHSEEVFPDISLGQEHVAENSTLYPVETIPEEAQAVLPSAVQDRIDFPEKTDAVPGPETEPWPDTAGANLVIWFRTVPVEENRELLPDEPVEETIISLSPAQDSADLPDPATAPFQIPAEAFLPEAVSDTDDMDLHVSEVTLVLDITEMIEAAAVYTGPDPILLPEETAPLPDTPGAVWAADAQEPEPPEAGAAALPLPPQDEMISMDPDGVFTIFLAGRPDTAAPSDPGEKTVLQDPADLPDAQYDDSLKENTPVFRDIVVPVQGSDAVIHISGMLPETVSVHASAVSMTIPGEEVLGAWDIRLLEQDGSEYQIPDTCQLKIEIPALSASIGDEGETETELRLYHMDTKQNTREQIPLHLSDEGTPGISFSAKP